MRQIVFTAREQASLIDVPDHAGPIGPGDVRGRTLVSLVSPGTELNFGYLGSSFPRNPGYACVFEVDEVGADITDMKPGAVVFGSGPHVERQMASRKSVIPLPEGLSAEVAVFARLIGVSMSTLNNSAAHPPARVLVTGLGPVGNLAAQVFSRCGYTVTAVDPVKARRDSAMAAGLRDVRGSVAEGKDDLIGKVALHLECSGHEQAALDGCKCVCKRGEVVLIGVPWKRRTDIASFEVLHAVFHRYAVLRSGWEWEAPLQPADFSFNSIPANFAAALEWLKEGSIKVDNLAATYPPTAAQEVYQGLLAQSLPTPGAIFDWRGR